MTSNSRFLVWLVIFMGILICVGVAVIGVTLFKRIGNKNKEIQVITENKPDIVFAPFEKYLTLEQDDRISRMTQSGDRISLLIRSRAKGEKIVIIDTTTGVTQGTIHIEKKD